MTDHPIEVVALVERSKELANFISSVVDGIDLPASPREQLAGACYAVAFDHHVGIVQLIDHGICSPALALLRPLVEAYICGSWLLACADQNNLENFTKRIRPSAERMIQALERSPRFKSGVLANMKQTSWKTLSGLTHTGIEQALGMMADGSLERNHRADELIEAMTFSGAIALLTAHGVAIIADDTGLGETLLERCKQWASD